MTTGIKDPSTQNTFETQKESVSEAATHTPGPWLVSSRRSRFFVQAPDRFDVAEASIRPEIEANARLISAAPDLLEVCKMAIQPFASSTEEQERRKNLCRAAIAKAEGSSVVKPTDSDNASSKQGN